MGQGQNKNINSCEIWKFPEFIPKMPNYRITSQFGSREVTNCKILYSQNGWSFPQIYIYNVHLSA